MPAIQIPKPAIFRMLGYEPHEQVVCDFHNSRARIRIPFAPARTSKSLSSARDVLADCVPPLEVVGSKIRAHGETRYAWAVGPGYDTNKEFDYWYTDLVERQQIHQLPYTIERARRNNKQGDMLVEVRWGTDDSVPPVRTIFQGKSAGNPESLQGEEVWRWLGSEAAEHAREIWDRYGSTRAKGAIFPTTPKLRARWLREMVDQSDAAPHIGGCRATLHEAGPCAPGCPKAQLGIESFHFTPACNPTYDWARYWQEHMLAEQRVVGQVLTVPADPNERCSPENGHDCFGGGVACEAMRDGPFGEQFGGLWTGYGERVLPFTDRNVLDSLDLFPGFAYARRYAAIDVGRHDPACCLWFAVDDAGRVLVYREIYQTRLNTRAQVVLLKEQSKGERLDYVCGDPMRPNSDDYLRELGLQLVPPRFKQAMRDRRATYLRLIDALTADPATGEPQLYVLSEKAGGGLGCPNTISEMRELRRKVDSETPDEFSPAAIRGADHAIDTIRYFLASRPARGGLAAFSVEDYVEAHMARAHAYERRRPRGSMAGPYPGALEAVG